MPHPPPPLSNWTRLLSVLCSRLPNLVERKLRVPGVCRGQSWCLNNQNDSVHIAHGFIVRKSLQRENPYVPPTTLEVVGTAAVPISQTHSRLRKGKETAPLAEQILQPDPQAPQLECSFRKASLSHLSGSLGVGVHRWSGVGSPGTLLSSGRG